MIITNYDCTNYKDYNNVTIINLKSILCIKRKKLKKEINSYYYQINKEIINHYKNCEEYSYIKIRLALYLFKIKYCLYDYINIHSFTKTLVRKNIKLIVAATDTDPYFRTIVHELQKNNIKNLIIEQGFAGKSAIEWKMSVADYIAVMGEYSVNYLIKFGIKEEKIRITGHPGFDKYINGSLELNKNSSSNIKLPIVNNSILFASQPYVEGAFTSAGSRIGMLESLRNVILNLRECRFIIKPHPSENISELKSIFRKCTNLKIVNKTDPIYPLICQCKIFITFFSTTAIEALLSNKPVINIFYTNSYQANIITQSKATLIVKCEDELKNKYFG